MRDWLDHLFSEAGQGFPLLAAALLTLILILRLYKVGWAVYEKSAVKKRAYESYRPLLEEAIEHYDRLTVICRQHPPGDEGRLLAVHQLGVRPDFAVYDLTGCSTGKAYFNLLAPAHQKEIREIDRLIARQRVEVIGTGRERRDTIAPEFMTPENLALNDHLHAGKTKAISMRLKKLLNK